jgi:hypothetical protein
MNSLVTLFVPREFKALYRNRWNLETLIQELNLVSGLEWVLADRKPRSKVF